MNNKPVAWMIKTLDGKKLMLYGEEQPPKFEQEVQAIPLHTHPADEKQSKFKHNNQVNFGLTDEEISDIRDEFLSPKGCNIYTFARALLKKAQEK